MIEELEKKEVCAVANKKEKAETGKGNADEGDNEKKVIKKIMWVDKFKLPRVRKSGQASEKSQGR